MPITENITRQWIFKPIPLTERLKVVVTEIQQKYNDTPADAAVFQLLVVYLDNLGQPLLEEHPPLEEIAQVQLTAQLPDEFVIKYETNGNVVTSSWLDSASELDESEQAHLQEWATLFTQLADIVVETSS